MEIVTIPSALRQHIFFSGKHPQSNPKQGLPTWPTPYVAEQGNKQTFVDVNLSATAGYEGGKMISMTGTWFLVLQCFLSHTFCLKFIFYESMFASEWKGPHLRIGLCACTCVFCLFFSLHSAYTYMMYWGLPKLFQHSVGNKSIHCMNERKPYKPSLLLTSTIHCYRAGWEYRRFRRQHGQKIHCYSA